MYKHSHKEPVGKKCGRGLVKIFGAAHILLQNWKVQGGQHKCCPQRGQKNVEEVHILNMAAHIFMQVWCFWDECGEDCFFTTFCQPHEVFLVFFPPLFFIALYILLPTPSVHHLPQISEFCPFFNPALESTNPAPFPPQFYGPAPPRS